MNKKEQAVAFAKEIKKKTDAMQISDSRNLRNDYRKAVVFELKELRFYCKNAGLDYKEILREAN